MGRAALGARRAHFGSASSSIAARDDVDELGDFAALFGFVAGCNGILDAMRGVISQNFLFGAPQRGTHRRKLCHDIDAVAVTFDHARQAADLALDPPQALEHGSLRRSLGKSLHAAYIPPRGMCFKGV